MKFYLILVSLLFTAITSMAQGTPTAIEGAPPETSRQAGFTLPG